MDMVDHIKTTTRRAWAWLTTRRLYWALSAGHLQGVWLTDYPQLYAPLAVFYAALALKH
jgi:hypothetical protein